MATDTIRSVDILIDVHPFQSSMVNEVDGRRSGLKRRVQAHTRNKKVVRVFCLRMLGKNPEQWQVIFDSLELVLTRAVRKVPC